MERLTPTKLGTKAEDDEDEPPRQRRRIRVGAYHDRRNANVVVTRRSASIRRGVTIRTMNRITKGRPAESPTSQVTSAAYLVAMAAVMPMTSPPTKVRGRLEK